MSGRLDMIGRTEQLRETLGADLERLLEECTQGSGAVKEAAWNRLLEEIRRMALDLGRRSYHLGLEDAEDMAQTVQLRVLERLPQLRHAAAFPLWVRRVIHHVALDMLRQRRPWLSLDAPVASDDGGEKAWEDFLPASDTEEPYDQVLLRMDLDRALARLPELYRKPIELHVLEGLPQDEVGRRLRRPRSTVATQIERGLHRLRRTLPAGAGV
jgi:RNA polymerase sigma factor (sigma-70 family)